MNGESDFTPSDYLEKVEITRKDKSIDSVHEAKSFSGLAWAIENAPRADQILSDWWNESSEPAPSLDQKGFLFDKSKLEEARESFERSRHIIRFYLFDESAINTSVNLQDMVHLILNCFNAARKHEYKANPPEGIENLELESNKTEILIWIISFLNHTVLAERTDLLKSGKWFRVVHDDNRSSLIFPVNLPANIKNVTTKINQPDSNLLPDARLKESKSYAECMLTFC